MKKAYNSALRKKFGEEMGRVPQFAEIDVKTRYYARSERLFEMKRGSLSCFIILVPSQLGRNEFTVELGWSLLGRPPECPGRPSGFPSPNHKEFENKQFVFRMADLIPGVDDWYLVRRPGIEKVENPFHFTLSILEDSLPITAKEAEAVMGPLVRDCVDKIIAYGIPYFEKLAAYWQNKKAGAAPVEDV